MEDNTGFEKVFKALSNPARLEIVRLLAERQFCVNALVKRMNISQAAVSQHLKILENAGLVKKRKEGCWIHYALAADGFYGGYRFFREIGDSEDKKKKITGGASGCGR